MPQIRPIGISGSVPTVNQLALGDIALNTYDGKAYIKKLVGSTQTIVELGTGAGGSSISASYAATASYAEYAVTASYALNFNPFATASYALTSSIAVSASYAVSSSYTVFAATASVSDRTTEIDVLVKNQSGNTILKGMVVRITGSNNSSDIPRVVTASYLNDNNSANTLGIAREDITDGSDGYVITEGILLGIDTSNYISGQLIYLGATGSITGSAPKAPLHAVRLGEVIRHQSNNGSIYVRIDNGYELGELHDVLDNTTTSSFGDLLVKSGSVWTNSKQLTGSYGLTGSLTATTFVGSLIGTASWAQNALAANTASFAFSSSLVYINDRSTTDINYPLIFKGDSFSLNDYRSLGADTAGPYYNPLKNTLGSVAGLIVSASSFSGPLTGSLLGTASYAENAKVFPFTGSAIISGSLTVEGNVTVNSATTIDLNTSVLNINAPTIQVPSFGLPYSPSAAVRTVMYDAVSNILFVTASIPGTTISFITTGSVTALVDVGPAASKPYFFLVQSGSVDMLSINANRTLTLETRYDTPPATTGSIFYSASGDFFLGTL